MVGVALEDPAKRDLRVDVAIALLEQGA